MCAREYVGTCECVWQSLFLCEGVLVGMLGFGPCEFFSGVAEGAGGAACGWAERKAKGSAGPWGEHLRGLSFLALS